MSRAQGDLRDSLLRRWVEEAVAEHPAAVAQLQAGETKVLSFLVGQVMRRSAGRADPVVERRQRRGNQRRSQTLALIGWLYC